MNKKSNSLILFLMTAFAWTVHPALAQTASPASEVNLLIGTASVPNITGWSERAGNTFPGVVCPHGMVAWSPDTTHKYQIAGGYYYPDDQIEDFSLTHFSGRGVPSLKNIAFLPLLRPIASSPGTDWTSLAGHFSHQNETASPGYYRVKFDNGITTDLTATPRTGLAHFTFPANSDPTLLIRASGSIEVKGREVFGYENGKTQYGKPYRIYFSAQLSKPCKMIKTWVGNQLGDSTKAAEEGEMYDTNIKDKPESQGKSSGAMLTFDATPDAAVDVRVGISYVSVENARDNLQQENPNSDLPTVQAQAVAQWNKELNRLEVEGGTKDERQVFYTALYHCLIHPNYLDDANGQYPGMDDQIHTVAPGHHQYQNIPAWDEHRSHSPLIAILYPTVASDIVQSLVNYAQQDASARPPLGGGLPRWEQVNHNSGGMIGDSDDSLISDALAFGAKDFDLQAAWEVMKKGASQPGTTSDGRAVRQGLEEYLTLGYVPKDRGQSVSMTLEYCSDDFALSQFANSLGDTSSAMEYLHRAQNWKNLFDSSTGYLRPRLKNGSWIPSFSPLKSQGAFTEGTPAQYLWQVNFNYRALLDKIGGNEQVVARLDHFFTQTNAGTSNNEFAYMGNEPSEETPWVYDFAAAPWRTQAVVRRIQTELFTNEPSGLPGNDDAGALSSWYVFSALGLYPDIPGVAGFVVGSPVFPKATIHLENGKKIEILGEQANQSNPYVQGLKVNGQSWDSPWVPWTELANGGVLDFALGPQPSTWGNDPQKAPPSFDSK